MEESTTQQFNAKMRERTMGMAAEIYNLLHAKKVTLLLRPAFNQVLRSSSSVAANYRAASRARSEAEFYAKICIVVEECDETQFWLEYMLKINILTLAESAEVVRETIELVKISTTMKKTMKDKLNQKELKVKDKT